MKINRECFDDIKNVIQFKNRIKNLLYLYRNIIWGNVSLIDTA